MKFLMPFIFTIIALIVVIGFLIILKSMELILPVTVCTILTFLLVLIFSDN